MTNRIKATIIQKIGNFHLRKAIRISCRAIESEDDSQVIEEFVGFYLILTKNKAFSRKKVIQEFIAISLKNKLLVARLIRLFDMKRMGGKLFAYLKNSEDELDLKSRDEIISSLCSIKYKEAAPYLIEQVDYRNLDSNLRLKLYRFLLKIAPGQLESLLFEEIEGKFGGPEVKFSAIELFWKLPDPKGRMVKEVARFYNTEFSKEKVQIIETIGYLKTRDSFDFISKVIDDPRCRKEKAVRKTAISYLPGFTQVNLFPVLSKILKEEDDLFHTDAFSVLKEILGQNLPDLPLYRIPSLVNLVEKLKDLKEKFIGKKVGELLARAEVPKSKDYFQALLPYHLPLASYYFENTTEKIREFDYHWDIEAMSLDALSEEGNSQSLILLKCICSENNGWKNMD